MAIMTSILVALFENKHLKAWGIQDEKALNKKRHRDRQIKKLMPLNNMERLANTDGFTGLSGGYQKQASRYFVFSKHVIQKRPLKISMTTS